MYCQSNPWKLLSVHRRSKMRSQSAQRRCLEPPQVVVVGLNS
jgi:hypothetical protein